MPMLSARSDPQYRRGMGFLSVRRAETDVPDPEFVRASAQFLMQHEDEMAGGRWAAVSNQPAVYGMQRMFSILSEATGVTTEAFMDFEAARKWLLGREG
jgi:hypothetical protein